MASLLFITLTINLKSQHYSQPISEVHGADVHQLRAKEQTPLHDGKVGNIDVLISQLRKALRQSEG